ncbi:hypothetical protein Tco_1342415 [Tanacetum coccineum]
MVMEEIVVRRANQKLYTFKEGDFPNLYLNDIEDMLLLHVQNKLFNLDGDKIIDLAKKLNITKPQKDFPGISAKEVYTTSYEPKEVVYLDSREQKRLMRADELYKFSNRTLKSVCEILHYRLLNFKFRHNIDIPKSIMN